MIYSSYLFIYFLPLSKPAEIWSQPYSFSPVKLGLFLTDALSSDVDGKLISSLAAGSRAREKFSCTHYMARSFVH